MVDTKKISKRAAWEIAIVLYVQSHPNGTRGKIESNIQYRTVTFISPIASELAFLFSTPDRFISSVDHLRNEVHITGSLMYDDSSGGPAKSMPTGPWYIFDSWYQYFPYSLPENRQPKFSYTENPLAYFRFPVELAPAGVFQADHYSPPIGYSRSYRFSARAPDEVFRQEIATYIERHLILLVEEEYKKWHTVGRFTNFLYFTSTFGLGEINPNSDSVRSILTIQIVLSVVIGALIIPGLLSYMKKKVQVLVNKS